jgi:Uma2 family endonuclease
MSVATKDAETLADMLRQLGNVPPERILMIPAPGTATAEDVLKLCNGEPKRLCELVDGVLVEKAMGQRESRLAVILIHWIMNYLDQHDLGIVTGADGPFRLYFEQVRFPDVAFIAYDHIPSGADPATPMPDWTPNLAVEILSESNTRGEMERKLRDYFAAGVELVWYVDPEQRTVRVYTSIQEVTELTDQDTLDGGTILPGFSLSIAEWFNKGERIRPNR